MTMSVINVSYLNFDEIAGGDKPVLLDFSAVWCGPCRMVAPILEEIASEREDIVVGKIDVDDEPELARRFGVVSIPMLVYMKNGQVIDRSVGARPMAQILDMIK